MLYRNRVRGIVSIITSCNGLAIFNWSSCTMYGASLAVLLKRRERMGYNYDNCGKKSSKMPKRDSKTIIWNQINT